MVILNGTALIQSTQSVPQEFIKQVKVDVGAGKWRNYSEKNSPNLIFVKENYIFGFGVVQ